MNVVRLTRSCVAAVSPHVISAVWERISSPPKAENNQPTPLPRPPANSRIELAYKYKQEADNFLEQSKYIKAIESYTLAIGLAPHGNPEESYLGRGIAKFELKEYQDAIKDFDNVIDLYKSLEAEENSRKARGGTGVNLALLNLPKIAAKAYTYLSNAHKMLGHNIEALKFAQKCKELDIDVCF